MFAGSVLVIPRYLIISYLGWINTYAALCIPAWGTTLCVFLMRNFITHMINYTLLEAARNDGASEW